MWKDKQLDLFRTTLILGDMDIPEGAEGDTLIIQDGDINYTYLLLMD